MSVLAPVILWWVVVTLIGWAAVPLAWRLFPTLADRGFGFARPLGLLLAGYLFWLGGMSGVVPNRPLGAWLVVAAVAVVAAWSVGDERRALATFLRSRRRLVFGYEALYLVAFAGWAWYRAYNPNIETSGGEKYMEMAFISAVLESPAFPPLDPWLSGFSISYYYFAYIIAGMLVHLTGVDRFVAFNLLTPMTLGMTLAGAFAVGYNLVALSERASRAARVAAGAFTAYLVALAGSLHGAIELGYLRGWGPAALYDWLDIKNLTVAAGTCADEAGAGFGYGVVPPAGDQPGASLWVPTRFIWWWRGSRVIHDQCGEIIHEFPFFSFMLADVHPHISALPYAIMVVGLALALAAGALGSAGDRPLWSPRWLLVPFVVGALGFFNTWDLPTYGLLVVIGYALWTWSRPVAAIPPVTRRGPDLALAVAGLAGVGATTWRVAPAILAALRDVPPEAQPVMSRALLALAAVIAAGVAGWSGWSRAERGEPGAVRVVDTGRFAVWLALFALLFYLPFHIALQSQVSGVGVVAIRSRLPQWLVHFGLHFFLAVSLVAVTLPRVRHRLRRPSTPTWLVAAAGGAVALASVYLGAWTALVVTLAMTAAAVVAIETWREAVGATGSGVDSVDVGGPAAEVEGAVAAQVERAVAAEVERAVAAEEERAIAAERSVRADAADSVVDADAAATAAVASSRRTTAARSVAPVFALACVAVGLLLPLGTEFVFLRDLFNSRMNTIFKLYYQAWVLMAIGGGYAAYAVWRRWPRGAAGAWTAPLALLVAASLYYPLAATYDRTNRLTVRSDGGPESGLSLDGLRWWKSAHPEDLEAAAWIRANVPRGTTILETYGGGYAHNGRLSMATGRPTVLGWEGHEHQWRGVRDDIDPRKADIETIYKSSDTAAVERLLDQYGVRYVILGGTERAQLALTAADDRRLEQILGPPVWRSSGGQVLIFHRP